MIRCRILALALCLLACTPGVRAEDSFVVENTNFLLQQPNIDNTQNFVYDYNRLRLTAQWRDDGYFATGIGDVVNYLGYDYIHSPDFTYVTKSSPDVPFALQTDMQYYDSGGAFARIYRLYGGYEDDVQRISAGILKVSMGVGRIWTPTDLYNPKNSYALEPDEVYGVLAASYAYALSDLSVASGIVSVRRDRSLKYAARYKGYLDFADVGLDYIHSDDTTMAGYEIEGNLFDTGAEWRSEGGYFKNTPLKAEFFQGIAGFDYGFENGLTWAVEGLYSSQTFSFAQIIENYDSEIINNMVQSPFYLGTTLTYDFDLAFSGSLLLIDSFRSDNSLFASPALTYTFNDHNSLSAGAMLNQGNDQSEFGRYGETYYLKWFLSY
jgi:hypothetical protein